MDYLLETETEALRSKLGESYPSGVPPTTNSRISYIQSVTIGHEIGHGVGLFHPFDPISSTKRPAITRPRYHDRLRYNSVLCQYETGRIDRAPSERHSYPRCQQGFSTWDSGTTIMDYGSETAIIGYIGSSNNRYSGSSAAYLVIFLQSTTYLSSIHDVEYMFVSPSVAAAHLAKPLPNPRRKTKPQWTSSSTDDTGTDTQGTNTTPPDQPYGLSYSIVDGQFRLLWSDDGGTVTSFEYQYRENGGSWSSWLSAGSSTFIDLLNLVNGTTYQFQVRAMNGTLVIAISDTFEVRVPTVPDAPTITRVDSGDGQVNINWTTPSNNGGSDITDYEYQYRESNGGTWEAWTSFGDLFTSTSEDIAG